MDLNVIINKFRKSAFQFNKNQQKINQTKQIRMRKIEEGAPKQFVLAKFQPGNVLLIHRYTKKAYNYFEVKTSQNILQQLNHSHLLRPYFYGTGLLYPKGQSNLKIQLQNRTRAFNKQYFNQDELINTFLPLFQCIQYLHKNNVVHGQVHPQNILLINEEIKLRDWLVQFQENSFYTQNKKQKKICSDDFAALGQILAQFATLKNSIDPFEQKDIDNAIQSIVDTYSKGFIFAIIILLRKKRQFFKRVSNLLANKEFSLLEDSQLNKIYQKLKTLKVSKAIKAQPIQKVINIMPTPKKTQNLIIQSSPNKKFNITHTNKKSSHRGEDTQNKRVFNEQVKKRQIQKITKIIQKSNAFVNELMARKNNNELWTLKNNSEHNVIKSEQNVMKNNSELSSGQHVLKKISGKNNANLGTTINNISMYSVEPGKKSKEPSVMPFSPNKRMRTISKKK